MSSFPPVLAIDGPVASGKGTVARSVAQALGFHLLDSGAIYRAFALACLARELKESEINKLSELAKALSLKFDDESVWLDGRDATLEIRSEAVGMAASKFSAIPEVRAALLERQRAFAQAPGLVADGRDMGTVVFQDATLKIFLTATADVRAARRAQQIAKSTPGELTNTAAETQIVPEALIASIRQRDMQDKARAIAPLKPATDAIVIDNALQTKQETIESILALWTIRTRA